jgi:hypothetical protein
MGIYQVLRFNSNPPDLNKKDLGLFLFFLVKQEGILDTLQFPIYLMISVIFFSILKRSSGLEKIMYLLCITVVLFVAAEEISWGQNYLYFDNLDFFDENNL